MLSLTLQVYYSPYTPHLEDALNSIPPTTLHSSTLAGQFVVSPTTIAPSENLPKGGLRGWAGGLVVGGWRVHLRDPGVGKPGVILVRLHKCSYLAES